MRVLEAVKFGNLFFLTDSRERGRERVKHLCEKENQLVASCTHCDWGLNPQPRQVT